MIASTPTARATESAGRLSDSRSAWRNVSGPFWTEKPFARGACFGRYRCAEPSAPGCRIAITAES